MFKKFVSAIFGNKQDRDMRRLQPIVDEINSIYAELENVSDEELQNKTSEFRRLLGVTTRQTRVGEEIILHERAEDLLQTHPDVKEVVFAGSRRDMHPGELTAWVIPNEGVKDVEDLATQIRGGMTRIGQGYSPSRVVVVDELPRKKNDRDKEVIDKHLVSLATEQLELPET